MAATLRFQVSESTFELYPPDVYDVQLANIEQKTLEFNGEPSEVLEFTFEFLDGEYQGKRINDIASWPANGLTPKTKLRQWIEGMTGKSLKDHAGEVDLNKLLGRKCRINVSVTKNSKNMDKNKITSILPPKAAGNGAKPAQPPVPASDLAPDDDPF
jgi:hypothetical protein